MFVKNNIKSKEFLLNELYSLYFGNFKNTPLYISGASNLVCGDGNPESKIVFIGEAPGADEDKEGKPFVGRSGKLLTLAIELTGIKRSDVFITNIVKCRPPENRTPTEKEIEIGKNLILKNELSIIEPKIIVTLGSSSLKGLVGKSYKITKCRGSIIKSEFGNIFPIYHPSYILRNQSKKDIFLNDIKNAIELANNK